MKPFVINRKSWHYKLNKHFMNEDEHFMERGWEPKHNNFCSYWRATMFRLIFATAAIVIGGGILSMLAVGAVTNPMGALYVLLALAGIAALIFGGVALALYLDDCKEKNKDKPKSIVVQRYLTYKSKICPMVEYETSHSRTE